jgi:poly-gamma-glutamate synthesis protein (capsule biosynthesis protein)
LVLLVSLSLAIGVPQPGRAAPDLGAYPWLYLRGGEPLAAGETVIELIAVGDVMLGRGVSNEPRPLAAAAPWLRTADVALANLECVIAAGGTPRPGPYRLPAPLSAVGTLREAGFDLLGLANNHALDLGPEGLAETVHRLQKVGIATVGAGPDAGAAMQPLIREIDGLRLALLAFNAVPDPEDGPAEGGWTPARWDRTRAAAAVAAVRPQVDAVVVSLHWGYEYDLRPDPAQREAAQALLDAGADLVVGHHPHVVQGTQISGDRFVAYSLGNLVFDQAQGETQQGLALRAFFDAQGLRAVQALPLRAGLHPRLLALDEAASLLSRVQPPARRAGFACDGATCHPVDVPQTPKTGLFQAGAADLTGDGVPEQVRLAGEQVFVSQNGVEVWRGLPQWRVLDLALGDPNDDGRQEILLALDRPDPEGIARSHPFIVGYREGAYRVVWGGSAVADPIREVELDDVDGDGVQELIVLEARGEDRVVAVWRWHGWGFSLIWRSPPGDYRDLALIPGQEGDSPVVSVSAGP